MKIYTVDSFTDKPFCGNPAAVCILSEIMTDEYYQLVAKEINYSETAFVIKQGANYGIRWFTPKSEVDLCGHATLAAAKILFDRKYHDPFQPIKFDSKSGVLIAKKVNDIIELDFPQMHINEVETNEVIEKGFGIKPDYIGKNNNRYLIEIDYQVPIEEIKPDFQILAKDKLGRFIITARSIDRRFDFISRFFAPKVGILEDPATGSSHCYLAPYWAKKLGKTKLIGFQASDRTGVVECKLAENNRVLISGQSVIMHEIKMIY